MHRRLRATSFALSLAAIPAAAPAQGGPPTDRGPIGFQVQGGGVYQFPGSLDGGGDVSATRWFVEPGVQYTFSPRNSVGISIGYGETAYDFSGRTTFGGGDPWGTARDLRVSLPIRFGVTDSVGAIVIPSVRWNAEDGADLDDGRTEGVIAAANWRISESFAIGPGIGVFSSLEDGATVFPFLALDWDITDRLNLGTGGGLAATRGPGLVLSWQATDALSLGLGGRYETLEFRLDDAGRAPGGVGEETAFPLFLTATYAPLPFVSIAAVAGIEVGGELTLRDRRGRELDGAGYDPAPFLGLTGRVRF